ncbi:MAG: L-glutamate gamma-semialdehyde dehydrogenase, partial [Saprospiraceae bacterium]|nr:L-glutamate gamma-semialdehyde dehydrogenase [Saprospiraceae bacterium]
MNADFTIPPIKNEIVKNYAPGSPERKSLQTQLIASKSIYQDIKMSIGGKKIANGKEFLITCPHDHKQVLGHHYHGSKVHVHDAITAALKAKASWASMPWQDRAAIFLKAADLLSGPYRNKMNAATMLCQSKNVYQSEIDAVAEFCDFLRYNVKYMTQIYAVQPSSAEGIWNRLEYRPLEGFVVAITPFNFTSIAGNLPCAPALLGNTVVWKPADTQIYSAALIIEILEAAGLPDGVINLVTVDGPTLGSVVFDHKDFAGLHFTGSTGVFQNLWKTISNNLGKYKSYPRIVGETGGKDFVLAHSSADPKIVATALIRGAFEYQGQKCSAASRAYIPKSLWKKINQCMGEDLSNINMGSPEDFTNFINAVIDEKAFDKISSYIANAKKSKDATVIHGGQYNKSSGYFIQPTVILTGKADYTTMVEEIFGPVLTVYLYDDKKYDQVLELVDSTSPYALTGAVFAQDKSIILKSTERLQNAAGNFYINDKPTGAVVD